MKRVLTVAAFLTALLVIGIPNEASAFYYDYPDGGICPGSLRKANHISRCPRVGPRSGMCPPGKLSQRGTVWAYDTRNCR